MATTIIHVDDNMHDLELASLAFAEIDPAIRYVPIDEADLLTELQSVAQDHVRPPPALIIIDMNMPQMSAVQVIGLLRDHERLRRVPVAILTSVVPRFDADELGVPEQVPLLIKPGTYEELVVLLRGLVERTVESPCGDSAA